MSRANESVTQNSANGLASEAPVESGDRKFTSTVDVVRNYLDKDNWNYDESERNGHALFSCSVAMTNADYRTVFDICEAKSQFGVYVYSHVKVPQEHRAAVAEYIARINYRTYLGKWDIDMEDGEIRTAVTVDVEGSALSPEMVCQMENVAHRTMDRHYPGLMSICYGNLSAAEAMDLVDKASEVAEASESTAEAST